MADTYIVDIDVERLRDHRSRLEHRDLSAADVRRWLVSYGFYPRIDGLYLCEEEVLHRLDPSEVVAARPVGHLAH